MYNEILNLFKGNSKFNEWMNEPFIVNNYAVATDAISIIYFDKSLCPELPDLVEEKNKKSVLKYITEPKNIDLAIPVSLIEEGLSKCELSPGFDEIDNTVECEECNGSGEVEWEYDGTKHHYMDADCPVCDGDCHTGSIIKKPNGKTVYSTSEYIEIQQVLFSAFNIGRLLHVAKMLNEEAVSLVFKKDGQQKCTFKIGSVELILMPCLRTCGPEGIKFSI